MGKIRQDAERIIQAALRAALPDSSVKKGLEALPEYSGKLVLVSIGKAAWQMAQAALEAGIAPERGIVISKHGHMNGPLGALELYEAGHPLPDEGSVLAAGRALELTEGLSGDDLVLVLISGGASALFEAPLIPLEELKDVTAQLLACGADITEINTIRKRLSAVKGGCFALHCAPARVYSVILSDVLGDVPDMIASGPCCADPSTAAQAEAIAEKYALRLSDRVRELLRRETPKELANSSFVLGGSVRGLCAAAAAECRALGYETLVLTDTLSCQAREAGAFMAAIARFNSDREKPMAFIAGGETVVKLIGKGKGGRNQELALSAAEGLAGLENALLFSLGSDGTDGPTDAAGGMVTGETAATLRSQGISIPAVLENNDAYHALERCGGLIITGPTGTNVNDVCCLLLG